RRPPITTQGLSGRQRIMFIRDRRPYEVVNKVKEIHPVHHHVFHALGICPLGKPAMLRMLDHIWGFDTGLRSRLVRRWRR
ncbi:hypothetical protein ACVGXY_17235, partial [Enterobacter intestinihominis]